MVQLFLLSVFIISVSCQQSTTEPRYYFFNGFEQYSDYSLKELANIVQNPNFDLNKPTVLYLHGFRESIRSLSIWAVVNAYIKRNDHNILVLDWSKYSYGNYFFDAIPNMLELTPYVGISLIRLFDAGLNISKLHLVGNSLGGQFAGQVGRAVINYSNYKYKIRRIIALDPAGPGFNTGVQIVPLNPFDADIVEVIHTDAGGFGISVSSGTVDFWPNGGIAVQPGCIMPPSLDVHLCSHGRAWMYWAESVTNQNYSTFPAVKAHSWFDFINGRANRNDVAYMGLSAQSEMTSGNYFLQTNSEAPFSKGEQGLQYEPWP